MKIRKKEKTLYIQPECELIASQVEKLRDGILNKLKKELAINHIVLDVKNVGVVDSLGVNLIIGTFQQSKSQSLSFEIVNASENFIKVANFFQFKEFFNVSPEKKSK